MKICFNIAQVPNLDKNSNNGKWQAPAYSWAHDATWCKELWRWMPPALTLPMASFVGIPHLWLCANIMAHSNSLLAALMVLVELLAWKRWQGSLHFIKPVWSSSPNMGGGSFPEGGHPCCKHLTCGQKQKPNKFSHWHLLGLIMVLNVLGHLGPPASSSGAAGFFWQGPCWVDSKWGLQEVGVSCPHGAIVCPWTKHRGSSAWNYCWDEPAWKLVSKLGGVGQSHVGPCRWNLLVGWLLGWLQLPFASLVGRPWLYHLAPWPICLWLVWFSLMSIMLQMSIIFRIIAMQSQWSWHNALKALGAEFTS